MLKAPVEMSYTRYEISTDPAVSVAIERKSHKVGVQFDASLYYKDELPTKLKTDTLSEVEKQLGSLLGLAGVPGDVSALEPSSSSRHILSPKS